MARRLVSNSGRLLPLPKSALLPSPSCCCPLPINQQQQQQLRLEVVASCSKGSWIADTSRSSRQGSSSRSRVVVAASASNLVDGEQDTVMVLAGRSISRRSYEIATGALLTVVLAVSNKVLYKMALVPLRDYPFFLAQVNTFGYVLVYSSILLYRYHSGIVTREMLALPKSWFVLLGALEAIGLASGMAAAAVLSGALIPVLTQAYLVWQLVLSRTFLRKRFTASQVVGCLLVLAGVMIVVWSGASTEPAMQQTGFFWPAVMIVSSAFSAAGSIIKEFLFRDAAHHSEGRPVDLFVVNTLGSSFQALFIFLLLPVLSNLRGIPFHQLPGYLREGFACFLGGSGNKGNGAPMVPILYVLVNLAFNISALNLLKMSSAVVSSLCTTLAVPMSIWMFTRPLPLLGAPATITTGLYHGSTILVLGLVLYNFNSQRKERLN